MDRSKLIEIFSNFAKEYDFDDPIIALKFNHSLQTANYCLEIASSLALTEKEQLLAFAIGLLHEVGSFESWKHGKVYSDIPQTLKMLFKNNLIERFDIPKKFHKTLYFAISQHKSYEIDTNKIKSHTDKFKNSAVLYREIILYCKILKDANTIDFYGMIKRKVLPATSANFAKIKLSKNVLKSFKAESKVLLEDVKSKLDQIVFDLSLYFELKFDYSFDFCKKIDFADAILNFYKDELSEKEFLKLEKIIIAFKKKIED